MKTFQVSLLSLLFFCIAQTGFAQSRTEQVNVSGSCGMCKKTIEKSAKAAGATTAEWNRSTKVLTVSYDDKNTSMTRIQQAIADAGYDTRDIRASDEAYEKLDGCCKYERSADAKAVGHECTDKAKDGKCDKDKACCQEGARKGKSCCKKS